MTNGSLFQRGFAAMAAIFLVVVLAALGAFMVSISNSQQLTSTQDLQGSRAYWAAQAGLEWAMTGITANAGAACPASPPTAVDGFSLAITCAKQTYTEAGAPVNLFQLKSIASTGAAGSLVFIERSVSASMEK